MKNKLFIGFLGLILLSSCDKDKEIINNLAEYNATMQSEGYNFGDVIKLPKEVTENAESISVSFGDKETSNLNISPEFYLMGENNVTFNIKTKSGKTLQQDAVINVFAKKPEVELNYEIVNEYPRDPKNFVQGFQLDGNTIYESNGQYGASKILKYTLGSTTPMVSTPQSENIFSEGSVIVGDKVFQLTWRSKKGFIYNKKDLKPIGEFAYPNLLGEGWGLTFDGEHLIASDGSSNLYFLDAQNPSELVKYISVAGHTQAYTQLNELEYHNGFIYANVWQEPIIIKINPKSGEVVAKFDFSAITKKHTTGTDDVLNGIAFKGDNMLITGKNWNKIYEIAIK